MNKRAHDGPEPIMLEAVCAYAVDGPFAGLSALLYQLVAVAERTGQKQLIAAHDNALMLLAPSLAERYSLRYPLLTLTIPYGDAVRTFPADFVTRAIHGAIDFVFALQDELGRPPISLGLIELDQAGPLAHEFLTILARRAAGRPLYLWASVRDGVAQPELPLAVEHREPRREPLPAPAPAGNVESAFGAQIEAALAAGERERAHTLLNDGAIYLLRRGFTKDCLLFAERAYHLQEGKVFGADRWPPLKMLMRAALAAGAYHQVEALVAEALGLDLLPRARANCLYILSMLHTRYYADRNINLAQTYMADALATLESQPDLDPGARAFYRNAYALIVMRQGRLDEAYRICAEALADLHAQSSPERYRLHKAILPHNLGRVQAARGDHAAAIAHFSEAIALDPYYADLYLDRGLAHLRLGQADAAEVDFVSGLTYGLPSPHLSMALGNAYIALGRPQDGLAAFNRALDLDDGMTRAYKDRGLCFYDLGRCEEALADYDRYLAHHPGDAEALVNRASLRDDLGDAAGALADLDEALRLGPTNVAALANRAVLLAKRGDWSEALQSLDQAIALDPENSLLRQNRTMLVEAAAQAKEAG